MWTCDGCGRTVRNNDFACDLCLRAKPGSNPLLADKAARRDLVTEAHFRALALWFRVGGGSMGALLTVGALYILAASSSLHIGRSFDSFGRMAGAAMWLGYTFMMVICGLYFVVGHFLSRYHNWARIVAVIITLIGASFSLISLVWMEIATAGIHDKYGGYMRHVGPGFGDYFKLLVQLAWAAAVTKTLLGAYANKIVQPEYRAIVEETRSMKPNMFRSPFFVFPAIVVGIAVLLLLLTLLTLQAHTGRF